MLRAQTSCLYEDILHMAEHNIRILDYSELTTEQKQRLQEYYEREVYPILTPFTDPGNHSPLLAISA